MSMAERSRSNNFLLTASLVLVMAVVLVTSSFFYFSLISENSAISAHVVYDVEENGTLGAETISNSTIVNQSNSSSVQPDN